MTSIDTLLSSPLKHLAYALFGPRLMAFPGIANSLPLDPSTLQAWFEDQRARPERLAAFLTDLRSPRLGIYHEALWQYFLQDYPEVALIAHNVPVRDGGATLGEFDFIVRHLPTQQVFHIEVATKYYLSFPSASGDLWFGPSLQDRFDLKAGHLLSHQIQLSETAAGQTTLAELGVDALTKLISVGGMLFYGAAPCDLHAYTHADHAHGKHLTFEAFCHMPSNQAWTLVPRHDWLAPLLLDSDEGLVNHAELCQQVLLAFEERQHPVMIASLSPCAIKQGVWREQARLFVTPNDWEEQAANVINAF